jgi:hypothetical protein
MVTITLHCPHCQSDALVRNGHAPNGKQLYRCRACGRQSRENPTPHAYPHARREEILHASARTQQSAWPHPHGSRVSRTTVSSWIKKKSLSFLPYAPPCSLRTQRIPLPRSWNWTNCGRLCSKKPTTPGFGLPCAERADRWSLMLWVIAACRTCQRLWEAIPSAYRQGHCFTDFWAAYSAVIAFRATYCSREGNGRNGPRRALE